MPNGRHTRKFACDSRACFELNSSDGRRTAGPMADAEPGGGGGGGGGRLESTDAVRLLYFSNCAFALLVGLGPGPSLACILIRSRWVHRTTQAQGVSSCRPFLPWRPVLGAV